MRLAIGILTFLVLLAPLASAAPGNAEVPAETPHAVQALQSAGDKVGAAASATAAGAAGLAQGAAHLAADAAGAVADALVATFAFLGSALATLGRGVAGALAFVGRLLGRGATYAATHPLESANAAGAATSLGFLLWCLKRLGAFGFLAPLYTRLAPSQMLDNEARQRVYEHVRLHPGAHPSGIAEALGLGWGTVIYHLAKLESTKLVTVRHAHHRKCYFTLTSDLDADARTAVAAMSTDKARAIVETVREAPGMSQKALAEKLGMSQALASWHVKRLVASGVLLSAREGRSNVLRVAAHVPLAA